ncbi:hypothetical protein EIN_212150 [Entamoeba invadens IP1]|uniref:Proteasome assembly chaperone 2 n=1 Tax=Entamoeba invadens IP1 TaxID=370355 RepID=A0A0A1TUX0_ENTIV|nr:hypothetical protein EIN_212150 [Entamoeba invadens IP1]ELP84065.1 hypothetical protein EIN_212150 [Entamoeba invadens IP1]|eukprot:XP_004183411.1 hypothetical protein EIN_212150 [Entamoeba invadens IP1]
MKSTANNTHQGTQVFIPCLTIGNVGQLCADLLINTFSLPESSHLQDDALLPYVAPPVYDHIQTPTTAMSLYSDEKLSVFQIRSTVVQSLFKNFCDDLANYVQKMAPSHVFLLHSNSKGNLGEVFLSQETVLEKSPIASYFYKKLSEKGLKVSIINSVCYDGDTRNDALKMFKTVLEILKEEVPLKEVKSWNTSTLWGDLKAETQAAMF